MKPGEEWVAFYYEIGQALSQWAYVETKLVKLASICLQAKDFYAAPIGFLSIENFRSRLQFCDNLVTHQFASSPHFPRWKTLHGRLSNLSTKRNKIAHRIKVHYADGSPGRRMALVPWIDSELHPTFDSTPTVWQKGAKARPPSGSLCVRDIAAIRREFHALTTSLENLCLQLSGHRAMLLEQTGPSDVAPSLREIGNDIRHMMGVAVKQPRSKASQS